MPPVPREWGVGRLNNHTSSDGTAVTDAGFAGHCDWRLSTIQELETIIDVSAPGCGSGSPCIDPIFGPTAAAFYWSATTVANGPDHAWHMFFLGAYVKPGAKTFDTYVRAVHSGP